MSLQRQDNRIQRWQGELQGLLTPVEEAERQLQELLLQLEHPTPEQWHGQPLAEARPVIQRLQLQQLLAQRQRQVQQLQAELRQLRQQCWSLQGSAAMQGQEASEEVAPMPAIPPIFG
jgi:polyhydroxyalkanoate synthesis regulator phasin